jgi:hypothetical protein
MKQFVWGMLTMAHVVAALLFLRSWRSSGDRLFLFFAAAFAVLALNWFGLSIVDPAQELRHYVYSLRLLAFVLLVVAIVDKNRNGRS